MDYLLDEILHGLVLSMTRFQQMCVAAGCDYLKNLKGIGIHRAFQMASGDGDMLNALEDGAYYCYCAYVLRIPRYSDFLSPMLTNTGIFLRS